MRNLRGKTFIIFLIFITAFPLSYAQSSVFDNKETITNQASTDTLFKEQIYKVTFIELGSVKCIPCREMQTVMKSIGEKYGKEINIVFYDVLTKAGEPYALKYKIEAIPTQVFLDAKGKEFYRHIGFFPEEELVSILKIKGVKPN
jgi:thioredoxin 1